MSHLITPQGVRKLLETKDGSRRSGHITVQVIHIKSVPSAQGERFRVVLSDSENFVQGMMSSQMNVLITEGTLTAMGLLSIEDHMFNEIQGKTIVILLSAFPLNENPGFKIGNPVDISLVAGNTTAANSAAAAPTPLYNSTNSTSTVHNTYNTKPMNTTSNSNAMNVSPTRSNSSANPYGRPTTSAVSTATAPIVRSSTTASSNFNRIADLNLYHSKWTIKARVTNKSDIRTWSNAKGEGSLFAISLLDESGVDIRATFFKEAVDRFYQMLQEGQVYTFSGGRLKVANAQFNTCKSPHEITFDQNSEIHLSSDSNNIQKQSYDFVESIASIESYSVSPERPILVDVLAFVQSIGEPSNLISKKKGQEFTKCEVVVVDDSQAQINVTLWNEQALKASSLMPVNELVAVCRARVSDYGGGKSLSGAQAIVLARNEPVIQQLPAYDRLLSWYKQTGGQAQARSLSGTGGGFGGLASFSDRKCIADIKREQLGYQTEKGDYISFAATVAFLKKDKEGGAWYPACPNPEAPCKNMCKVTPDASTTSTGESWACERCGGTFDRCVRRWIFSAVVEDSSGSTWVTFFNESAEVLLDGKTADEIHMASDGGTPSDPYDSAFAKAAYTEWVFKCKVKNELVNEELKRKTQVVAMHPMNYVQESKDLLAAINKF
ncbi:hypothetical protein ACA910_003029 [Epithemia clementina (nom. ined.)]